MLTTDGSLPQQLGGVWSRLLEADSEGPSFISHAACARSVSSSRTFLSCACGAPSAPQRTESSRLRLSNHRLGLPHSGLGLQANTGDSSGHLYGCRVQRLWRRPDLDCSG